MAKSADGFDVHPGDRVYAELFTDWSDGPVRAILDENCEAIVGSLLAPRFFVNRALAAKSMLPEAARKIQEAEREKQRRQRQYARLVQIASKEI